VDLLTIGRHLGRIADALERAFPPPPEGEEDGSKVFYTSDEEHAARELERLEYRAQTGISLPDWEEVPRSTKEDGTPWR